MFEVIGDTLEGKRAALVLEGPSILYSATWAWDTEGNAGLPSGGCQKLQVNPAYPWDLRSQ